MVCPGYINQLWENVLQPFSNTGEEFAETIHNLIKHFEPASLDPFIGKHFFI
jgi:hypothetical protein